VEKPPPQQLHGDGVVTASRGAVAQPSSPSAALDSSTSSGTPHPVASTASAAAPKSAIEQIDRSFEP
jgi:hypothetical protein